MAGPLKKCSCKVPLGPRNRFIELHLSLMGLMGVWNPHQPSFTSLITSSTTTNVTFQSLQQRLDLFFCPRSQLSEIPQAWRRRSLLPSQSFGAPWSLEIPGWCIFFAKTVCKTSLCWDNPTTDTPQKGHSFRSQASTTKCPPAANSPIHLSYSGSKPWSRSPNAQEKETILGLYKSLVFTSCLESCKFVPQNFQSLCFLVLHHELDLPGHPDSACKWEALGSAWKARPLKVTNVPSSLHILFAKFRGYISNHNHSLSKLKKGIHSPISFPISTSSHNDYNIIYIYIIYQDSVHCIHLHPTTVVLEANWCDPQSSRTGRARFRGGSWEIDKCPSQMPRGNWRKLRPLT